MSVIIQGTGKALPEKCMKNTEIASVIDTSDDWIKSHTGITSRRVASETDTSATLASAACMSALQNACERGAVGLNADSVDLILCATATPQYSGFPSNACLIQQTLGAHNAACFDLSAACSGFLYALDTAASLMERHSWRYALVCGSEVLTRIVDWKDRSTCILFGDGAGAVVLENTFVRSGLGIGAVVLGADGTGAGELYLDEENRIRMNGRAVYNFGSVSSSERKNFGSRRKAFKMRPCKIRVQYGKLWQHVCRIHSHYFGRSYEKRSYRQGNDRYYCRFWSRAYLGRLCYQILNGVRYEICIFVFRTGRTI